MISTSGNSRNNTARSRRRVAEGGGCAGAGVAETARAPRVPHAHPDAIRAALAAELRAPRRLPSASIALRLGRSEARERGGRHGALREQAGELLVVDDVLANQQAAADVIAEISAARPRPPAPDRALAPVPDHDQVGSHLLRVGGDLPRRLADDQLARGLEAERLRRAMPFLQDALVVAPLLGDARRRPLPRRAWCPPPPG